MQEQERMRGDVLEWVAQLVYGIAGNEEIVEFVCRTFPEEKEEQAC